VEYKRKKYDVELWDTAGQESMETLRRMSYPDADVFLVCYSVNSSTTLGNVTENWINDIEENASSSNMVLVACKADLRESAAGCTSVTEGQKVSLLTASHCFVLPASVPETCVWKAFSYMTVIFSFLSCDIHSFIFTLEY